MRKLWRLTVVSLFLLLITGCKQATKVDWPLYQIKNGEQTAYLLGSIHIGEEAMYPFPNQLLQYIDESDELITEVPLAALMQSQSNASQEPPLLMDEFSSAQQSTLLAKIKDYGYTEKDLEGINRLGLLQLLQKQVMTANRVSNGVEFQMYAELQKHPDWKNTGFETFDEQMALLLKLSKEPANVDQWLAALPTLTDYQKETENLIQSYIQGNVSGQLSGMTPQVADRLLTLRNEKWLFQLIPKLENGDQPFVLVGAGHLPGEHGLIKQLEHAGYQVTKLTLEK